MLKTDGIPLWVTIFALLVALNGVAASIAVLNGVHDVESGFALSWAGRNFGLGLVALAAVLLKSPVAYLVAFLGGVSRDVSDLIGEMGKVDPNAGIVAFLVVFLGAGIAGLYFANRAR